VQKRRGLAALAAGLSVVSTVIAAALSPAVAAPAAVDRAPQAGIFEYQVTWAATPVDYDSDGDQDVWIGYHQRSGKLWSNDGDGTYTRVALAAWPRTNSDGKIPDRHDCAFADVDQDGRPDAYCSAGRNQNNVVKYGMDNELWRQLSGGVFTETGTSWGLGDLCGRGRRVTFLNANGDQFPDLFVGNESPRDVDDDPCNDSTSGLPNEESKLFLNNGGMGFAYVRNGISGAGPGQRCAVVLDVNGDGWDDLLACRYRSQTPRLYRNNAGRGFTEVSLAWGLRQPIGDAVVADMDGDGDSDLVTSSASEFAYRLNTGTRFAPPVRIRAAGPGEGRSVAVGDADGDGDLDAYCMIRGTNQTNPDDVIMLNNGRLGFTALVVPPAGGEATEVVALDPAGTGRTEFLVLNGGDEVEPDVAGPIQLIRVKG
jgi:FG-GAP-like repeat